MFELTDEQRQELSAPEPTAVDPQTREEYVLVRKVVYERLKGLLEDDAEIMYPMLADLDSEDWEPASTYADKQ
jgi:hypothetical protein